MANDIVKGYYNSKYYVGEEIDQRLLQNYYDDAVEAGYRGSKEAFLKSLASLKLYNFRYIEAPVGYVGTWGIFNSPSVASDALSMYFNIQVSPGTKLLFYDSSLDNEFTEYTLATDSNSNLRWVRNLRPEELNELIGIHNILYIGSFLSYESLLGDAASPSYAGNSSNLLLYADIDGGATIQIHQVLVSPTVVDQTIYKDGNTYTRRITFSNNTRETVLSVTTPVRIITAEEARNSAIQVSSELFNNISEEVNVLQGQVSTLNTTSQDLQNQVNQLVQSGVKINLSISPSVIYTNSSESINLTGTSDIPANELVLKEGDRVLVTGQGTNIQYTDQISPTVQGTQQYSIKATIRGVVKTVTNYIYIVDKIYYGSGLDYTFVDTYPQTAKRSPAGTYIVTVENNAEYIFFNVPSSMTINKATLNGFDFPLNNPVNVTIDGVSYKSYRSSNTNDEGTYTIILS